MRIGLLATEFPPMQGGMAEFALGLATAMAAKDDVVTYTCSGLGIEGLPFPVHDSLSGRPWVDGPPLSRLEERIDAWLAINAGLIPLASPLGRPFFVFVHGNDLLDPWLACGPRWLESVHRPYAAGIRHELRRRAIRRHASAVRHLMVNSRSTASLVCRHLGVGEDRLTVIPPGVREEFFQDREPNDGAVLRLLTVSRLSRHTRRKNVDGVLHALARLGETLPIRYTVVGDGDDRQRLQEMARELGLGERVDFLGSVNMEQLLKAYRESDLFVLASRATKRDIEGFGIVYLEANASGVPVICSREGGATDAVVDGQNGLLIDRSTPEAIADGILRFVQQRKSLRPDSARELAERQRWPKVAARVRAVLKEFS